MMMLQASSWPQPSIPPHPLPAPAAGCTRRWPHAITVVSSQYHMHQIGASMVTRHLRGGLELPPLRERRHWDFAYQVGDAGW
jgi:hypothetical protein